MSEISTSFTIDSIINYIQKGGSKSNYPNSFNLLESFECSNWDLINSILSENLIETLNCKDDRGNTILHNIILSARSNPDKSEILLNHLKTLTNRPDFKDSVDIPNNDNKTAFYMAVQFGNDENNEDLFKFATILDQNGANKDFGDAEIVTEYNNDNSSMVETSFDINEFEKVLAKACNKMNVDNIESSVNSNNDSINELLNYLENKLNIKHNDATNSLIESSNTANNVNTEEFIKSLGKKYVKTKSPEYSATSDLDSNIFIKNNSATSDIPKLTGGSSKIRGTRRLIEHTENSVMDSSYKKKYSRGSKSNSESDINNELGKMIAINNKVTKDDLHKKFLEKIKDLLQNEKLKSGSKNLFNKKTINEDALTIKSFLYRKEKEKHPEKTSMERIKDLNNMSDADIIKTVKKIPDLNDLRSEILQKSSDKKQKSSTIENYSSDSNNLDDTSMSI